MRWAVLWIVLIGPVLTPFFLFEDYFNALAERIARGEASSGWAALTIGALLALDVLLPVPSSIVSTAAGVLADLWRGAAVVWIGMMIGCLIGYFVGVNLGIAAGYAAIGAFSIRLDSFLMAFVGAIVVPGLALVVVRLRAKRFGETSEVRRRRELSNKW